MAIDAGKVVAMLELDTGAFSGGLNTARGMLKTFSDDSATATDKLRAVEKAAGSLGATMSTAVTLPLVAAGTAAVKTFASFDDAMRQVRATMNATEEETAELTEAAKRMGAQTRYSASESASALNYLALAGYDAKEAISALPTVLNLAQAGGLDLAYASDLVTDSMSALGLSMEELGTSTDQLAVTSQKSNTSISQLGQAILTVGGTAKALRGGTAELNAELGILADNGIKGAEGGTHLRNAILALQNPTEAGAKALARYTSGVYDAEGRLRSLDDIFGELARSMDAMNDAEKATVLNDIFNKTDLAAAQALIAGAGERFQELTGSIENCDGAAQAMADTMEGGIGGAFRSLGSATEGLAIEFGENLAPFVQTAAERVTELTRGFANLSESQQNTILTVGGLIAAGGPALLMISKIAGAIATINPVVAGVTLGLAGLAAAISFIRDKADWAGRLDRRLNIGISEVELEQYKLPEGTVDLGTQKASFRLEIENAGKSAYDQIKAIMNDGVPENQNDYATMAAGVNAVIDASMKAIEDNYNQKAANIKALLDSGVLNKTEYEQQMADLKTKTEEQEAALTASATEVTDYIKELIAANAPMTETQLEYLQQLIDKLVEVSVKAGEATDAVQAGYRLAFERVKSGNAQEGDIEMAAAYVEQEAREKADAINAVDADQQAEYGKQLEGVQEGTAEYEKVMAESAAAKHETQDQLAQAYAERDAKYAQMVDAVLETLGIDEQSLKILTDPFTVDKDTTLVEAMKLSVEAAQEKAKIAAEIGELDLSSLAEIVGYWAANGAGEAPDLSSSMDVLSAAYALIKPNEPEKPQDKYWQRTSPSKARTIQKPVKEIDGRISAAEEAAEDVSDSWDDLLDEYKSILDGIFAPAEQAVEEINQSVRELPPTAGEATRPVTGEEAGRYVMAAAIPGHEGEMPQRMGETTDDTMDLFAAAKRGLDGLISQAAEAAAAMEELYGSAGEAEEAAGEAAEGMQTSIEELLRMSTDEEKEAFTAKMPTYEIAELVGEAEEAVSEAAEGAKTALGGLLASEEEVFGGVAQAPAGMTGEAWHGGYVFGSSMGDGFTAGFADHAVIPGIATNGTLSGNSAGGAGSNGGGSGGAAAAGGTTLNITIRDPILKAEENIRDTARELGRYINAFSFGKWG